MQCTIFVAITLACLLVLMQAAGVSPVPLTGRRRHTGIIGLNLLLEGGFPEGTLIMVHGTPVSCVDLAAMQFWKADREESGTYLMTDDFFSGEDEDEDENGPESYIGQLAGSRMVVDSLSALLTRYGIERMLSFLRQAKEGVRGNRGNLMFIVYSGIHTPFEMTRLMRVADVVIEYKAEVRQILIERMLAVQKIRDGAAPSRQLPFVITEKGIEASTTSRVV
jgi:KaiC/GvpD/RAD55 family RecA-like ATPase